MLLGQQPDPGRYANARPRLAQGDPFVTDTIAVAAGRRYLAEAARLVERLATDEWANVAAAADIVANALARGGDIHAFGTGHSHMLAEELFYRAGGLVRVKPILFEGLMLHAGAELSHGARAPARCSPRRSSTSTRSPRATS